MKKKLNKIGIIGLGNMGFALAKSLAKKQFYAVYGYDKDRRKRIALKGVNVLKSADLLIARSGVVVLAIKPQDIPAFIETHRALLTEKKPLLISIAAGVPIRFFQSRITGLKVIRVMPNLCAKVNESVSCIAPGNNVSAHDVRTATSIFKSVGRVCVVKEGLLNKVTSISGSGPGYVFYFMHCLYDAALSLGLSRHVARSLVIQTFLGASLLASSSTKDFKQLLFAVASPKGTTEAAMKVFKNKRLNTITKRAVQAALKRAQELSFT